MRREVWPTSHTRRNMAREESTGPTPMGRVVPKSTGRAAPTFMERLVPKSIERAVPTSILYTRDTEPELNLNFTLHSKGFKEFGKRINNYLNLV